MSFKLEREMTEIVVDWLEAGEYSVRKEFQVPWGICDIVGCRLDKKRVAHRLSYRQTKAIGPYLRVKLLTEIPDENQDKCISINRLLKKLSHAFSEESLENELKLLIRNKFVVRKGPNSVQKRNGWAPLQEKIIAIELKLSKPREAIQQAYNNTAFSDESYIAMPENYAYKVLNSRDRYEQLWNGGIGIVAIKHNGCDLLQKSRSKQNLINKAIQMHCVERFWIQHIKGS